MVSRGIVFKSTNSVEHLSLREENTQVGSLLDDETVFKHWRTVYIRIIRSLDTTMQAMNGHSVTKSLEEQIDQWLAWDQVSCFQRKEHI